jgi:hypothetical protein
LPPSGANRRADRRFGGGDSERGGAGLRHPVLRRRVDPDTGYQNLAKGAGMSRNKTLSPFVSLMLSTML